MPRHPTTSAETDASPSALVIKPATSLHFLSSAMKKRKGTTRCMRNSPSPYEYCGVEQQQQDHILSFEESVEYWEVSQQEQAWQ